MNSCPEHSIRTAEASDVDDIQHCATQAYSKYIDRIGKAPAPMVADFATAIKRNQVSVAMAHGQIDEEQLVGYIIFYPVDASMHLENVAVLPVHCGKGVGRALINHVEQEAAKSGLASVHLYTNAAMTENLEMYPALGYTEYDRKSEDGFHRVYFRKSVN